MPWGYTHDIWDIWYMGYMGCSGVYNHISDVVIQPSIWCGFASYVWDAQSYGNFVMQNDDKPWFRIWDSPVEELLNLGRLSETLGPVSQTWRTCETRSPLWDFDAFDAFHISSIKTLASVSCRSMCCQVVPRFEQGLARNWIRLINSNN